MLSNCRMSTKWRLCKLFGMTTVKTRVGLLYESAFVELLKQIKAELTNRCSDVEILADVAVDTDDNGLNAFFKGQKRSKVKEIIVLIKARSFLDELNLEHLTS